jgi:hypothetical protein
MFHHHELALALTLAAQRFVAGPYRDAIACQGLTRQLGQLFVFAQQQARRHLDLGDAGAEPGKTLSQLTANRATARYHQRRGHGVKLAKLLPQRVAGDTTDPLQTRQRRHEWAGTSGNDDAARGQALSHAVVMLDFHRPEIDDAGMPASMPTWLTR